MLRKVPPHLLQGLREVFLFPPERSSMYLSVPGHGAEHSRGTIYLPADKNWVGFLTWEEAFFHEVGHSVHDHVLSGDQQAFLIEKVGWGLEWKEDFASCFGAYFAGQKARARKQHPHSHVVLQEILTGGHKKRDKLAEDTLHLARETDNPELKEALLDLVVKHASGGRLKVRYKAVKKMVSDYEERKLQETARVMDLEEAVRYSIKDDMDLEDLERLVRKIFPVISVGGDAYWAVAEMIKVASQSRTPSAAKRELKKAAEDTFRDAELYTQGQLKQIKSLRKKLREGVPMHGRSFVLTPHKELDETLLESEKALDEGIKYIRKLVPQLRQFPQ